MEKELVELLYSKPLLVQIRKPLNGYTEKEQLGQFNQNKHKITADAPNSDVLISPALFSLFL